MRGSFLSSLDVAIEVEPGKTNRRTEDACIYFMAPVDPQYRKELAVAVVVDEVTGRTEQARASHIALDTIKHYFLSHATGDPAKTISRSIQAAHTALLERKRADPELAGLGAAVTVAVIAFDREISGIVELYVGNAGSNRAYHFRQGMLKQLAADPTRSPASFEPESLDPVDRTLQVQPRAPVRYVGMPGPLVLQISPVELLGPGDLVLLCTHRLTDAVPDDGLTSALASHKRDGGARQLVLRALEQAGDANLAVMTLRVVVGPDTAAAPPERLSSRPVTVALLGSGLVIALLFCLVAFMTVRGQSPFHPVPNTATIEVAQFQPVRRTPTSPRALTPNPNIFPPVILLPGGTPLPTSAFVPTPEPVLQSAPTESFLASAPVLIGPIDGQIFDPGAQVYLAWNPVGNLPPDIYYAVTLRKSIGGVAIDTYEYFTKQTTIQIPASLLAELHDARPPLAIAWNTGAVIGADESMAAGSETRYEWFLTFRRLLRGNPDVSGEWVQLGSPSQVFTFIFKEPAPTATPRRYP